MKFLSQFSRTSLAIALLVLSSCASAPVKVQRVANAAMETLDKLPPEESIHVLLTRAIKYPESAEGRAALGHLVENWKERDYPEHKIVKPNKKTGVTYDVRFSHRNQGCYDLAYFDVLSPADEFRIEKISHQRREGVGAPLSALRENKQRESIEKYYPKEAITRALTATIEAGPVRGDQQTVTISLLCPRHHGTDPRANKKLAADFSIPWAIYLNRTGKLNRAKLADMFTRTPSREPQLYLMENYDPKKEPLIMVHGLMSSPLTWIELTNQLWADENVRKRYQVWHFLYNTSAPPLYSARLLRTQLAEVRQFLDSSGRGVVSKKATIICHSMGGILTRAQIVDPRDIYWKTVFRVPRGELKLTDKERDTLDRTISWEPDPTIHRVIFASVPHRGSPFADSFIGKIGRKLYQPPSKFQDFYRAIGDRNPGAFTPPYESLAKGKNTSVNVLSPDHPTLQILSQLPIPKSVQAHSIIGDQGKSGPLERSTDGVVPYWSSHLDGVKSELIVPTGHGSFSHPDSVKRIKEILNRK